ncbi:MAG TPA: Gfo/Idh/MocA family oxidoreductase, partial [Vicinamibacteria bacterium]
SRRPGAAAEVQSRYGVAVRQHADYDALLADPDIDVVDVCTPHHLHAAQALAAVRAGKHLILEKPIALRYEDAVELRAAIRQAGVRACVCFECRFSAHFTLVRGVLDQGLLGEVHYGEVDYFHGIGPWIGQFGWNVRREMGGSSLLTAGCHALDGLLFFMGGRVAEVTSYATRSRSPLFAPYEYATATSTLLRFEDGRVGKVASVVDCLQPYQLRVHLVGSEGSLLDNRFTTSRLPGLDRDRWSTLEAPLIGSGDARDHPYQPQFQAFVDSVRAGQPMPRTDFETAFETHRVVFAADRSAEEGRPVPLSEFA